MAPISLTNTTYTQDFDTLANSGIGTVLPSGWEFVETGTNLDTSYGINNGSLNAGNTYSYGATNETERAFGTLRSGSLISTIGASFTNNTGSAITDLQISFRGEQWRLGTASRLDRLDFQYSLDASSLSTGTYVDVDTLDFTTPNTTTTGAKDGNASGNFTNISATITGLNIANGNTFYIRYTDSDATGADDGLAIDNFSLTPVLASANPTVNLSVGAISQLESNSSAITITATASAAVVGDQTVTVDISGLGITPSDYNLSNTTITILNGQTTGSVTFTLANDSALEFNETATIAISNPSSGITLGTTTSQNFAIIDNDVIQITEYAYSAVNGEFVEFTNVGTQSVDLTGWSFDDASQTAGSFSLGAFGTVAAGESVILTDATAAAFRTAWGLDGTVKVIGGLTQNLGRGDEINLYDNTNAQVDRLTYNDQTIPGTIQAQNRSGITTSNNLAPFTINTDWVLSSVADAQNSRTSTGGDIGSPGTFIPTAPVANAPAIAVNTSTTTNFLDGGTLNLLPISGSGAVSGVIGDPTDPARTLGIDFTLTDTDTPVGNLIVTATSNNQAVVANANLNLTGTGGSRNLKITPSGVGFANITLAVSDGTNTTNYVVNYAASAASINPTTTRFLTGTSDASSAIAIDTNYTFVADDEDQTIRLYDRQNSGLPLAAFDFTSSLGLSGNSEVDIEASTRSGNTIYWLGSHSNNSTGSDRPNRERIFSTTISGSGTSSSLAFGGYYQFLEDDLIAWDNSNGHGLGAGFLGLAASSANTVLPEQSNGFNIEGLTFAPDGTTAYISFRAPNLPTSDRTNALIVPVTNFTSILNTTGGTTGSSSFGAPIFLNLGGRGIRSIERNASNQYIIVAGPAGSATGTAPNDFRLYRWTGNPSDAPSLLSANLTSLNTNGSFESIIEVPNSLTDTTQLQVLVDNGDTIWYENGTISKDLAQNNFQKFRSEIITIGSSPDFTVGGFGFDIENIVSAGSVIVPTQGSAEFPSGFLQNSGTPLANQTVGAILNLSGGSSANNTLVLGEEPIVGIVDNRAEIELNWDGSVLANESGNDFVVYENGFITQPEGFAVAVRRVSNGQYTNFSYQFTDSFDDLAVNNPTDGSGIFATAFDLSDFGISAGESIDSIRIINLIESDKVSGADGQGFVDLTGTTGFSPKTASGGSAFINERLDPDITLVAALNNLQGAPTKINIIQGTGGTASAGLFTIQGIVVGDFQGANQLGGFYVQEEDTDADNNVLTSEGIFVNSLISVNVGDKVRVTGTVQENNLTPSFNQAVITPANALDVTVLATGQQALVTSTVVDLPIATLGDLERYEGMLVTIPETLTVTEVFNLGRFGEVSLSANGRLFNPTETIDPNDVPASGTSFTGTSNVSAVTAQQNLNDRSRLILDDGSSASNLSDVPYIDTTDANPLNDTLRIGSTVDNLTGVLGFGFSEYRLQATVAPVFNYEARPALPNVGGGIKVSSFNVLNYFNGDGLGGGFPTTRGADTTAEFTRQRAKIIAAIQELNADVVGLIEMENDGDGANSAIANLVSGLNAVAGAGTYASVLLANTTGSAGTDEIKVAFLYKPGTLTPVGSAMYFNDSAFNTARPPLAQTFTVNASGEKFTPIVNHFKSKGSSAGLPGDSDQGDGQGLSNATRKAQATALLNFVSQVQTASGDSDVIVLGDLNAYSQEDPIDILRAGGLTKLVTSTNSYVFDGQTGSLDHALVTSSLLPQVTGAEEWNINSPEPITLDYNDNVQTTGTNGEQPSELRNDTTLYATSPFRSSDHDPVLVGLNLQTQIVDISINNSVGDGATDGSTTFAGNPSGVTGQVQPTDISFNANNIFESELEGLAANTNVLLQVTGNITVRDISDNAIALQTLVGGGGGSINLIANSDSNAIGAFIQNDNTDRISASGRNLNISGASLIAGILDTATLSNINGGAIALDSTANISTSSLLTYAYISGVGNTGDGGAISLNSSANITTSVLQTNSQVDLGGSSKNGGAIALNASGTITSTSLITNSQVFGIGNSGDGGNINLNGTGITTTSIDSVSQAFRTGNAGNGGAIALNTSGNISTQTINSYSLADLGNGGNGGAVAITSSGNVTTLDINTSLFIISAGNGSNGGDSNIQGSSINTGNIYTNAYGVFSGNSGNGGNINLNSTGNISTESLITYGRSGNGTAGNGGTVTINGTNIIANQDINTSAFVDSDGTTSNGGAVNINASSSLNLANVFTNSWVVNTGNAGNGGAITLNSGGNISAKSLYSFSSSNIGNVGNGGDIAVNATDTLNIGEINNLIATNNNYGNITLTGNEINLTGRVNSIRANSKNIVLQPFSTGQAIQIGGIDSGSSSILDITNSDLSAIALGFNNITFGRSGGTGTITINTALIGNVDLIGGGVNIANTGSLTLGKSEEIIDTSNLILNGGSLNLNGFNETANQLSLASSSVIDFGSSGSDLVFANSNTQAWNGSLTINNYTVGAGQTLRFGTDGTGLTATQLSQISFTGFTSTVIDSNGFVTPV